MLISGGDCFWFPCLSYVLFACRLATTLACCLGDSRDLFVPRSLSLQAVFHTAILNDTLFLNIVNIVDYSIVVGLDEQRRELVRCVSKNPKGCSRV